MIPKMFAEAHAQLDEAMTSFLETGVAVMRWNLENDSRKTQPISVACVRKLVRAAAKELKRPFIVATGDEYTDYETKERSAYWKVVIPNTKPMQPLLAMLETQQAMAATWDIHIDEATYEARWRPPGSSEWTGTKRAPRVRCAYFRGTKGAEAFDAMINYCRTNPKMRAVLRVEG